MAQMFLPGLNAQGPAFDAKRAANRARRADGIDAAKRSQGALGPGRHQLNQIHARDANRSRRTAAIKRARDSLDARGGPMLGPGRRELALARRYPTQPLKKGAETATQGMKMSKKSLLGIGLGMGVAAGVAMNRRGEGASSGRQSMYRY